MRTEVTDGLDRWDRAVGRAEDGSPGDTVLLAPATTGQVEALEDRLGVSLPPSYRAFLLRSNGARAQPGWGLMTGMLGLLDCDGVGWFRDRDRQYVDIWSDLEPEVEDGLHNGFHGWPEATYLDHGREPDAVEHKMSHVRYALQIANDIDGYTVLLNPLVVDQYGEWEAWDFGSKRSGGARHRSFAHLLDRDADTCERRLGQPRPGVERPDLQTLLADAGPDADLDTRQRALHWLSQSHDPRATAAQIATAREPRVSHRLLATVIGPLAASPDVAARRAAIDVLTRHDVDDGIVRSVWRTGRDVLWTAWRRSGNDQLLVQLASCGDRRTIEPMERILLDEGRPAQTRASLAECAWCPRDDRIVPALLRAALADLAPPGPVATALARLGHPLDAVAVLTREFRAGVRHGLAEQLGQLEVPEAGEILLERLCEDPSPELARNLGHFESVAAAAALRSIAADPDLHLAAIDALERMPGHHGPDALVDLGDHDTLALRALARRRDGRALLPLLRRLDHRDETERLQAADGLRDLRDPTAAAPLLRALERGGSPDFMATAAHAIVSAGARETPAALDVLASRDEPELRRLAVLWSTQ